MFKGKDTVLITLGSLLIAATVAIIISKVY